MMHLGQAINVVPFGFQCVKHGATTPKWRTLSFLEEEMDLIGAEDDDEWISEATTLTLGGALIFGTCCIWKFTVELTFTVPSEEFLTASILVNSLGLVQSVTRSDVTADVTTVEVDLQDLGLIGSACGNVWTILTEYDGETTATVEIRIIDVTFGPPTPPP